MSRAKSEKSKRDIPEFPDLLLCLGWVNSNGGRGTRDRYSAYLMEESTCEGMHIPYSQAVAMMKTHPLRFVRRISVASVQQWVYRMVNPTEQSAFQEMMTMMRYP
jgi:hypothetical protein